MAERLLIKSGFSRDSNGDWLNPEGEPWVIDLQAAPDEKRCVPHGQCRC
ncbi:MAG: hypothetical protein R2851_17190 [Caldilineaceae bacterium]